VSRPKILIVDDERDMLENCVRILRPHYECVTMDNPKEALQLVESERPDLLLTDLKMPEVDGLMILRRAQEIDSELPVIIFTAFATIQSAVEAVKQGAFDYLPKPFSVDQLKLAADRALKQRRLAQENRRLREQLETTYQFENIVGRSQAMTRIFELVRKAARSEANILVSGESGTGKELIARAIHANSPRKGEAFVPVDCASLPEQLLESELFGHERGAFTGAVKTKPGLLEVAHQGTLFLDEIAELPMSLQVKLLRTLQEREVRRVGGTKMIDVDVRLVAATNRDLREAVSAERFREDLYYRVNVISIHLPPLRERKGDVALLAQHFFRKYSQGREEPLTGISHEVITLLDGYTWPGNVRELQNVIERACALAEGPQIEVRDFPEPLRGGGGSRSTPPPSAPTKDLPLKDAKAEWLQLFEREYLVELLNRHGGNVSQAAKVAQIDRKTIHRLINKYKLKFRGDS
jgi:DNA-binding NtrC family response regulator